MGTPLIAMAVRFHVKMQNADLAIGMDYQMVAELMAPFCRFSIPPNKIPGPACAGPVRNLVCKWDAKEEAPRGWSALETRTECWGSGDA